MKTIVNELFGVRRTNRYRHEERRKPIDTEVLAGWFCCAVVVVASWSLAFWIIRWAWNYWK